MRSKVTVVLLFLNVLLFFYIFHFEEKWRAERASLEARTRVYGPEVATIDSLTRTSRTGPPVRIEKSSDAKRGNAWWLTQPYEWPANPNAVARVLNELQFLKHETSFAVADLAKSGMTLADYGLDQPAITLEFHSAGKDYITKIGDDTKIRNRLYVLSPDGTRIHVVGRSLADSVGLPLAELRAESIFTVPVFEVRSLNVQTAGTSSLKVRLRRDSAARWAFETPILARASKSAVEVAINALNALTAKKFLEPRDTDLERAGLSSPALRVTLEGNARRETMLLGNPVPAGNAPPAPDNASPPADTEYYAKIEDKAVVFTVSVPVPLLAVLRAAQETLRDPRILDFEPGTVTALTIAAPGQPELTLQRLEAGTGEPGWQAVVRISGQAPLTSAADPALVTELLKKIHLLAAAKFLSDAPSAGELEKFGFNRPERVITLNLNTGGGLRANEASTLTLQIGVSPDEPGKAFAQVTNTPFVYQILPDILEETPALARQYRLRLLRELPESARITSLTLTDVTDNSPVYTKSLAEADRNWDAVLAAEPEARRKALTALLAQLRSLRAQRFVADTFAIERAETPQGAHPWKYRLDFDIAFAGGNGAAQNSSSTLFLTDRIGGSTLLAGTPEFGGVIIAVPQEMVDALFALTYAEKNDPGPPGVPAKAPVVPPESPKVEPPAKP